MCGIAGIFGITDRQKSGSLVQRMTDKIAHRGPDDQGIYVDDMVALGHRRLAILDLSPAGHQPMHSEDGNLEIIFNGEIYNFMEIRESLTGYKFKTRSDTEMMLAAYQEWGKECVHRFNGMFAFAIWDKKAQTLFIARDRLGIKPVYYHFSGGVLQFASEIRALFETGLVPRKIDRKSIADYFMYQTVHAPDTIIENVKMLMPGHHLTVSAKGMVIEKYWDLVANHSKASSGKTYKEVCDDVRSLFEAAVKRRLISDVPFGAFLSGGIDSSAVVGLMSKVQRQPVKTFNISFDESEMSEAKYARQIAEKFGTDHHEFLLRPGDFLQQLPEALSAMDHPSGDGPNSYVVSKITRENGITMALSGLGGDELFAGYPIFERTMRLQNQQWLWSLPQSVRNIAGQMVQKFKPGFVGMKLNQLMQLPKGDISHTFPIARQMAPPEHVSKLFNFPMPPDKVSIIINEALRDSGNLGLLSKVSIAEISTYMQNVLLRDTDQMSMASALEVRVPFIDYTLVEYVIGINDAYKTPVYPKKLLVESLGDLLPDEIVHRKKMGFSFPWEKWIRNELKNFCEERMVSLSKRSFLNGPFIMEKWNRFLNNDPTVRWPEIWTGVVLENWLMENKIEN